MASRWRRSCKAARPRSVTTFTGNSTRGNPSAARWGDWKAVRNGPAAKVEIYDLKVDANEKSDLADKRPELVEKALAIFKDAHVDHPEWPMRSQKQMQDVNKARKKDSK